MLYVYTINIYNIRRIVLICFHCEWNHIRPARPTKWFNVYHFYIIRLRNVGIYTHICIYILSFGKTCHRWKKSVVPPFLFFSLNWMNFWTPIFLIKESTWISIDVLVLTMDDFVGRQIFELMPRHFQNNWTPVDFKYWTIRFVDW